MSLTSRHAPIVRRRIFLDDLWARAKHWAARGGYRIEHGAIQGPVPAT